MGGADVTLRIKNLAFCPSEVRWAMQEGEGGRSHSEVGAFATERPQSLEADATGDVQRPVISNEHFCGKKLADRMAAANAACNCARQRWLMDGTGADDFMSERLGRELSARDCAAKSNLEIHLEMPRNSHTQTNFS